ncbi:vanadium-dependent haloperoxidase [Nocardioides ganghwensis]|uniref:Phosphatase PAP2 family protein n=1 Tax=Nocardioides ganghwensis TaxID=252230 RepID=A0A4Q2SLK4_9ACTN|nr:vanadium-dependent haloperoxidase [Nocardioides ganghwensis]MBD3945021.1 vanadium-dependent haloperoxidase [Nocardioides ganghwensis]RYC04980.1 hypothetical protein EUA07_00320 [Nocardioides ganghwensis]
MTSLRRSFVLLCTSVLVLPLFASVAEAVPAGGGRSARASAGPQDDHIKAAEAAVLWQRTAVRTIWSETVPTPAPPVGSMYLTFTSLAVHDAASEAQRRGRVAATAAVATAAHDVLWEYFPASRANLDAELAATMARIPDGKKAAAGAAIGAAAADAMIESRVGDGRFDLSRVYSKAPGVGVWQPGPGAPTTGGGMALAWLGFLKPVVNVAPVALDGPDPLNSAAYTADYKEVAAIGSTTSTTRTAEQTAISQFFANNVNGAYRLAVCEVLDAEPMGLLPTTRMFARMDAAVLTSFIQTFRLKFDVGFWRPAQAIAAADADGNPDTVPQTGWVALNPTPSYSDYTSGHAAATSPWAEVVRQTLGDDTPLVLRVGTLTRSYSTISALEHDALNARIWGGLHFRDAMDDGYHLGHTTAQRVMQTIH